MSTHRYIDRICALAAACALLLTLLFCGGEALGIQALAQVIGYEARLFDTSRVHTLDIVMDDWDSFIETCENEEYASCAAIIDGEAYQNVGIRAKGNTSLSMVSALGSSRYSFKLEFDHYESGRSYYGLDKLCLNNLIQDNTCMKDYLTYRLMAAFGVNAPLCSYIYLTVNGEDWGLYLAVEGVEEAFLRRNYGAGQGALYKPDSMSFGGGRGNGGDFSMTGPENAKAALPGGDPPERPGGREEKQGGNRGFGGMGSSDVKLQYTDDDPDSYPNIFDNAKTEITEGDQSRLIQALKLLEEEPARAVDMEQVLRYFVVHNFVCNGDSYTGSMVHNYYLYENEGRLSMIPWDYNLAFGTFQGNSASDAVNDPIDSPLSVTGSGDRPMIDWIFSSEEYTELYHNYFAIFLETVDVSGLIGEARALIAPYVERDPTKFCTYEEFVTGTAALERFCRLRAESVAGQLTGGIPSTSEGQAAAPEALVDAAGLTLSDMGTMGRGGAPGGPEGSLPVAPGGDIPEEPDFLPAQGELPSGGEGVPSFGDFPEGGNPFRGGGGVPPGESAAEPSGEGWLLASALVLLAGLAIAFRYRGRQ
ncbi:MAG: spore coat protein CotH [Oscillospiraceae bacterium]|nr:spore coat protein CotH [Oscillospiraceae bacterium]